MKSKSLLTALVTSYIFLFLTIGALVGYPFFLRWYFAFRTIAAYKFLPLMILGYLCDGIAIGTLIFLIKLLCRIGRGQLFDTENCNILNRLSLCCLAVCLLSAIGVFYYLPLIFLSIAAGFLFLILRVLIVMYRYAVDIKNENDMTI